MTVTTARTCSWLGSDGGLKGNWYGSGTMGTSAETGTRGKSNKSTGKTRCAESGEGAATGNTDSVHGSTRRRQLVKS